MNQRVEEVVTVACEPGESLLSALERQGHRVEYQCRQGYCGACRLSLTEGAQAQALTYLRPPLACHAENEVLTCCAHSRQPLHLKLL